MQLREYTPMDVEVKNKKNQVHLKDDELRSLIRSSQSGDQEARDRL